VVALNCLIFKENGRRISHVGSVLALQWDGRRFPQNFPIERAELIHLDEIAALVLGLTGVPLTV
jgi:hypothetical protein